MRLAKKNMSHVWPLKFTARSKISLSGLKNPFLVSNECVHPILLRISEAEAFDKPDSDPPRLDLAFRRMCRGRRAFLAS